MGLFPRMGGKSRLVKVIEPLIPRDIKVYVEPFVGGGSIFLSRDQWAPVEVINDLDRSVFQIWKGAQIVKPEAVDEFDYNIGKKAWLKLKKESDENRSDSPANILYREFIISYRSYRSRRGSYWYDPNKNGENFKKRFPEIQQRIEKVRIHNQDFRKIIDRYDGPGTFFYLDPPYSQLDPSWGYRENSITNKEILEVLKKIKGRFLMSYDDTLENRKLFKDFHRKVVMTRYGGSGIGTFEKRELLIANYKPI
jgi:DNA adenine methylase